MKKQIQRKHKSRPLVRLGLFLAYSAKMMILVVFNSLKGRAYEERRSLKHGSWFDSHRRRCKCNKQSTAVQLWLEWFPHHDSFVNWCQWQTRLSIGQQDPFFIKYCKEHNQRRNENEHPIRSVQ